MGHTQAGEFLREPKRKPPLPSSTVPIRRGNAIVRGDQLRGLFIFSLAFCGWIGAQPAIDYDLPEQLQTTSNVAAPCLEPAPLLRWEDYQGPFKKVVGSFARKLERKSARPPHYRAGTVLCSLEVKDKFILFVQDTFDPVSVLSAGFNAGLDQAANQDPMFGQGATGYGTRFGANFAGQTTGRFLKDFAYPTLFSEDPRYYRSTQETVGKRLFHATGHVFVAHRDSGKRMFNFSEWLGTASAVALNNVYHPGNEHGFGAATKQVCYSIMMDMGFDVLREFWPQIARKFHMPFRDMRDEAGTNRIQ